MKPTSHRTETHRRSGARQSPRFPITDSAYQSIALDGYRGGCAKARVPSFRSISGNYFKTEARHSFVTEAIFFGVIVLTAAWPMLQNVRAMAGLVRAFAGI